MNQFRLLFLSILFIGTISASGKKLNVIVVTGGHDFDRVSFFQMFDSFEGVRYTELKHPEANLRLGQIDPKTFDAVVFYDMPKVISEAEKESYQKLIKLGKGLLFLHHSQCSYQQWDDYINIVGGKYHGEKNTPASSTYQHDVTFTVKVADPKHQVTKGIKDFEILDEVYGNTEVLPEVTILLTASHPQSSQIIGWTHKRENSRIVYLQPGHDKNAFFNPNYQKLIKQSIAFVSKK